MKMKYYITVFLLLLATQAIAQGWRVYKSDGTVDTYYYEEVDSIVPYGSVPANIGEAIDLGLSSGTKWASCNVGAIKPEDYGDYYAWGETETKSNYSWSTYAPGGSTVTSKETCGTIVDLIYQNCGGSNADIAGTQYDVAHVKWGGRWKMPTQTQQQELVSECTWIWETYNGVNGYKVVGPNGNNIFLPAAGYFNGEINSHGGTNGSYWSSTLYSSSVYYSYFKGFNSTEPYLNSYFRSYGRNVRPVSE